MQVSELKEYLLNNNLVKDVLVALGCNHVRNRGEYISAANPDGGDNKQAIVVYLNDNLTCIDYTRTISKTKRATDIFDLISYFKDYTFAEALKWTCDVIGLNYYKEPEELPDSLQILKMLEEMSTHSDDEEEKPLRPISENILNYYLPYGNKIFENDNIDLAIQTEFEIGYDPQSNYITIPIRDSVGTLVGLKGRYFGEPDGCHTKYVYLEPCNKSRILYGYWQNRRFIKNSRFIFITESEKGVQQLASMGIRNAVSTSGKKISKCQVELIIRTGAIPIFCYDQDVKEEELQNIADMFLDGIDVYAIIDKDNILSEKESPSDNAEHWNYLVKNNIYKIK